MLQKTMYHYKFFLERFMPEEKLVELVNEAYSENVMSSSEITSIDTRFLGSTFQSIFSWHAIARAIMLRDYDQDDLFKHFQTAIYSYDSDIEWWGDDIESFVNHFFSCQDAFVSSNNETYFRNMISDIKKVMRNHYFFYIESPIYFDLNKDNFKQRAYVNIPVRKVW
jgi:hypothetical protein